jgi:hypothetical protein
MIMEQNRYQQPHKKMAVVYGDQLPMAFPISSQPSSPVSPNSSSSSMSLDDFTRKMTLNFILN